MGEVSIIKEKQELDSLKQAWCTIVENSPNNSVFLQYDWIKSVINSYNPKILIIVAKEENKIKGILPLQITNSGDFEFITCDTTTLNGVIYDGSYEILEALLDKVFEIKKWNILSLTKIHEDSNTVAQIKQYLSKKNIKFNMSEIKCPQILINKSWGEFKASKRERFRKMLRYITNRVNKLGARVELHTKNKENLFGDFLEVSSQSWLAQEGATLVNEESKKELYKLLFENASKNKWLYAWILRKSDEEPIAVEFDLKYNNKVYALMSLYKEKYEQDSPGTYLHSQIVKHCFENGIKMYDMGPGLNQYKLGWTENLRNLVSFQIFNNSIKSRITYTGLKMNAFLKNILKAYTGVK